MKSSLVLLVLSLILSSCGKTVTTDTNLFELKPYTKEEILDLQELDCAEGNCPSGVVRVLNFENNELFTCSGFLIAADVVVTNGHCVPKISLKTKVRCEDLYIVGQGVSSGRHQISQCNHLIDSNYLTTNNDDKDFAVIKLKKPLSGAVFPVSPDGIENDISLTAWTVRQIDSLKSTIEKKSCRSVMDHILHSNYFRADAPSVSINCAKKVIPGNSGSVLVDVNGRAKAILSHSVRVEEFSFLNGAEPMGLATNLKCVENSYISGTSKQGLCDLSPDELDNASTERATLQDRQGYQLAMTQVRPYEMLDMFEFFGDTTNDNIKEKTEKNMKGLGQVMLPSCIKAGKFEAVQKLKSFTLDLPLLDFGLNLTDIPSNGSYVHLVDIMYDSSFPISFTVEPYSSSTMMKLKISYDGESESYFIKSCRDKSSYML
jgi:hypothetical protein